MRRTVRHKTLDIEQQTYRKTSDVIHQTWKHQKSDIGHQKYDIGYRTSDIRHQPVSDIRHESYRKTSAIGLKTLDIGQQTYSKTSDVIHQTWKHQKSDIGHQKYDIGYRTSDIRHQPVSDIRHESYSKTSAIGHKTLEIGYQTSDIRHTVRHQTSLMYHGWCLTACLNSDDWFLMMDVWWMTSDVRCLMSDVRWLTSYCMSDVWCPMSECWCPMSNIWSPMSWHKYTAKRGYIEIICHKAYENFNKDNPFLHITCRKCLD